MARASGPVWATVVLVVVVAVAVCAAAQTCEDALAVANASAVACNATLETATQALAALHDAYVDCGCDADPCAGDALGPYSLGLHVAAVFIVFVASALGTAFPLLGRSLKAPIVPYILVLGKSAGIGVILAVALIHMLQPAQESLTSPCLPATFNADYPAFAYMFALLAALLMHFFDYLLLRGISARIAASRASSPADGLASMSDDAAAVHVAKPHAYGDSVSGAPAAAVSPAAQDNDAPPYVEAAPVALGPSQSSSPPLLLDRDGASSMYPLTALSPDATAATAAADADAHGDAHGHARGHGHATERRTHSHADPHQHPRTASLAGPHAHGPQTAMGGHVHMIVPIQGGSVQKVVAAYMLEFGVTTHSLFIGLAVGITDDAGLRALLVALCFHQFFEGLALGSRLAEARLPSYRHEIALSLLFAVSAPIGIAIGVGVATSLNANSAGFLLVQGIFDALCAGILLYLGFSLLLHDFGEDMEIHCQGQPRELVRRLGMFTSMWLGAAIMAVLGLYL
jgi:hypothetical protein